LLHVIDKQTLEHSGYYNSFEWTLDDYTDIVKEVGFPLSSCHLGDLRPSPGNPADRMAFCLILTGTVEALLEF